MGKNTFGLSDMNNLLIEEAIGSLISSFVNEDNKEEVVEIYNNVTGFIKKIANDESITLMKDKQGKVVMLKGKTAHLKFQEKPDIINLQKILDEEIEDL